LASAELEKFNLNNIKVFMKKLTLERMAKIEGGRMDDKTCSGLLEKMLITGMIGYGDLYMKYC
jgi:hypothetical protein